MSPERVPADGSYGEFRAATSVGSGRAARRMSPKRGSPSMSPAAPNAWPPSPVAPRGPCSILVLTGPPPSRPGAAVSPHATSRLRPRGHRPGVEDLGRRHQLPELGGGADRVEVLVLVDQVEPEPLLQDER